MKGDVEVLRMARDLISDPERWCKGAEARNRQGDACHVVSTHAVRWCALGAVRWAGVHVEELSSLERDWAVSIAIRTLDDVAPFNQGVAGTNDHGNHDAVMGMFSCAIQDREAMR